MQSFFKYLLCLLVAAMTINNGAMAQPSWPNKPVKIVVGFPAGTPPDTFARIYGEFIAKRIGQPVVIENKPGAAGNLATETVAKSPADGYTFLYNVSSVFTVNPFIYSKRGFDPDKDLVPVGTTLRQGLVLVVNPDKVKANNLKEILETATSKPDAFSYASYGAGSYSHLIMEWLLDESKTKMLHVPYRGGALTDMMGGLTDMMVEPIATGFPFIQTKRVKAIAYTGSTRHPALPDVPTFAETVPGMSVLAFHGIWAPAATPQALVTRFNAEMVAASKDPGVQQSIRALNCEPLGVTPAEMGAMVKRDADIFSRIVKAKNIHLD